MSETQPKTASITWQTLLVSPSNVHVQTESKAPATVTSPSSLLYHTRLFTTILDFFFQGEKAKLPQSKVPSPKPEARWRLPGRFRWIYFSVASPQNGRLIHSSCIEYRQIQTRATSNQNILKKKTRSGFESQLNTQDLLINDQIIPRHNSLTALTHFLFKSFDV